MNKTWPKDTVFGAFFLVEDHESGKTHLRIRQQVTTPDGKRHMIRYPKSKYASAIQNREHLTKFVDRLNYGLDLTKKKYEEMKSAFIPEKVMESFRSDLDNSTSNKTNFRYTYKTVLHGYFLGYFIETLGIADPREWSKRQADWGAALLGNAKKSSHNIFDKKPSSKTIKETVQIANRFMKFMHLQMPDVYPLIQLQPLSKSALKTHQAEVSMANGNEPVGRYITAADWLKIDKKLPSNIGCFVRLMYYYGVRRAESLGFDSVTAVRKGSLKISKQLQRHSDTGSVYSILKDKEARTTPHWFCSPEQAYSIILDGMGKKMHPRTLSEHWDQFMRTLGMEYNLHDFRRTFITNALRGRDPLDVMLAVGHANIETTMKYLQDDRALSEELWTPKSS